jgi:autotransporter-associated beta strand protein
VNHTGTLTNSGTGSGATLISAGIDTNVTGVIQNSSSSALTLSGSNYYTGGTTVLAGTLIGKTTQFNGSFGTGTITLGTNGGTSSASLLIGTTVFHYPNNIVLATGHTGTLTLGNIGSGISVNFTGSVTGNNNLTIANNSGNGNITFDGLINNVGTVSHISGIDVTGITTINGVIGSHVTGVIQSSSSSELIITSAFAVGSYGKTLTNTAGKFTITGGFDGIGNEFLTFVTGLFYCSITCISYPLHWRNRLHQGH